MFRHPNSSVIRQPYELAAWGGASVQKRRVCTARVADVLPLQATRDGRDRESIEDLICSRDACCTSLCLFGMLAGCSESCQSKVVQGPTSLCQLLAPDAVLGVSGEPQARSRAPIHGALPRVAWRVHLQARGNPPAAKKAVI